jgi:hypothetical protein
MRIATCYLSLALFIGSMFAVSCTGDANAQCSNNRCRVVQRQAVAVATVVPTVQLISVPAYSAGYQQGTSSNDVAILSAQLESLKADVAALKQQNAAITDLAAQVKALTAQLAAINGAVPPGQAPPVPKPEQVKPPVPEAVKPPGPEAVKPPAAEDAKALATFMTGKCASCHEAKVAKQKGGNLVFFDGAVMRALTCELSMDCIKQTKSGAMPKGKALTDAEFGTFEDLLLAQVKTKTPAKP